MNLNLPEKEKNILDFWRKNKIFEKSLERTRKGPRFVFYEGPPFANGLPGIHHLLARAFKDVILRYKTMKGFYVERRAGWDTHGLPTEMEAEKKLGIKNKKEIEENIERFITECRNNVFTYKKEWEEFTERIGFWLDLKNAYITCSNEYIESLWWILKRIWKKKLLYKDYKIVPFCPRCGTSLSSHEVAQGYKNVTENSVYVKFPIKGEKNSYLLVWTTTPWTLPGNVAVAVNPNSVYLKVKIKEETFILAKERAGVLAEGYEKVGEMKGKELLGLEYEPLFPFEKLDKKAWFVVPGSFVSLEEGTGLVHIAPAFGEEDMEAGKKNDLPVILNVDEEGKFKKEVKSWAGLWVKEADPLIVEDLKKRKLLFKEEMYAHDYPFCWRCDSPLLYYAKESWFIKITALKEKLIKNNGKINWVPDFLKEGRFGEWLKEVKDWNLSRERYWGTPLPIWQCGKCAETMCIGSIEELKKLAGKPSEVKDLHRPYIDKVLLKCKCGGEMKRVQEVIDCWFDSGAMPFAKLHYPFENKELVDKKDLFPADFICEGIDQTRGWFYTLLAVSTLLGFESSYRNVVVAGIVLDSKGQKMSKSKGNVVRPSDIIDKYGADAARMYFYTINPVSEPKKFDFKDIEVLFRRFFDTIFNVEMFFNTYAKEGFKVKKDFKPETVLDRWIVSSLEKLNLDVIEKLDKYDAVGAARLFEKFVEDLSNWYIRRSRRRFQNPETEKEKEGASHTLHYVLLKLSSLLAPFTPFASEALYQDLGGEEESVHLASYPSSNKKLVDEGLQNKMEEARNIVAQALAERAKAGFKVRQPLQSLRVKSEKLKNEKELAELIKTEVNVKDIIFDKGIEKETELDLKITPELKEEGAVREIIRWLQDMRKKAGLNPKDRILVDFSAGPGLNEIVEKNKEFLLREAKAKEFILKNKEEFNVEKPLKVDGEIIYLAIKKV